MKNREFTTIYVNPVPRVSAQGRDKQVYTVIDPASGELVPLKGMGKTKEFKSTDEYPFIYNPHTQRLQTGLEVSIPNPFYKMEARELIVKHNLNAAEWTDLLEYLVEQESITKQTYYEIIDGQSPDHYTSKCNAERIWGMTDSTKSDRKTK